MTRSKLFSAFCRRGRLALAAALAAWLLLPGCTSEGGDAEPASPGEEPVVADTAAAPEAAPDASAAPPTVTSRGRSVEKRIEDASLAAQVQTALVESSRLRPFDFDPSVTDGRVTLAGNVATRSQGDAAAEVAAGVDGVSGVRNRLTVEGEEVAWSSPAEAEAGDQQRQQVAAASPPPGSSAGGDQYHTVASGESLWTIARAYDLSVRRLKRLNNLRGDGVQPGDRLRVRRGRSGGASRTPPTTASSQSSDANSRGEQAETYHVVEQGESLWTIARDNDTSVDRLKELNSLSADALTPGDRLRVE